MVTGIASSEGRLIVKLVHIDSPASPYRRKYDSPERRDEIWTKLAASRLLQIYHHQVAKKEATDDPPINPYSPRLSLDPSGVFLASLGVGTPVKPQLLAMDTGSSVTWVTCVASPFQAGDYSYLKSTTFMRVTCADPDCVPYGAYCAYPADECPFTLKYMSSGLINGIFVKDTLTFSENLKVPNMMFGCGFPEDAPIREDFTGTGVMGLSNHPFYSMATQFGSVFSYCIGNMHDPSYGFNTLILNEGLLLGNSTPILNIISKNYVNLKSITVRGEVLDINPIIFDRDISHGGTIMDSASAKTLLADDAYNALRDKLKQIMAPVSAEAMCFYNLQPSQVPEVQYIFEQGAKLSLGMEALFSPGQSTPNVQCFNGVKPTSVTLEEFLVRNLTLIGINAQQFHNIGYDYTTGRMYISKTDCDDLPL
uniref:Peptidase A1 domain-containing protein n=1 Tax=Kalanchoe fedtschenkoi TaxID=63787 RepID=A0A7N0U6Y9_KALFE